MIYKYMLENNDIIDGIIQDPEDPGVDLDAVEKAIAGEDGIAAHQDEVDAATDGMIGDPVEEFAMIMYESEYNYNQMMEAIGMAELREAAMGRDLILEKADIAGFFKKVKEFFVNMFARITEAVRNVLAKLDLQTRSDKKFVAENKDLIEKGFNTDWNKQGYVVDNEYLANTFTKAGKANDAISAIKEILNILRDGAHNDVAESIKQFAVDLKDTSATKKIIHDMFDIDAESLKDLKTKMHDKIFGGAEKIKLDKGNFALKTVTDTLSNDKEAKLIRNTYKEIKKVFTDTINELKRWEKNATLIGDATHYLTGCNICINYCKIARTVSDTGFVIAIDAARYKRNLCRDLAHEFVKASKGDKNKNSQNASDNATVKTESGSLFDHVFIV